MNELARRLMAETDRVEPNLAETFDQFEAYQAELDQLLDMMGTRSVIVEIPPAGNADATLRANVSGTDR
jgi:hypothetical protein